MEAQRSHDPEAEVRILYPLKNYTFIIKGQKYNFLLTKVLKNKKKKLTYLTNLLLHILESLTTFLTKNIFMSISNRSNFQAHPFHLVSPSPWPLYTSTSLFTLTLSAVLTFHSFSNSLPILYIGLISLVYSMSLWFRDVTNEATYLGNHTLAVQRGLNMGVGLFVVSEALFFLAIF